MTTSPNVIANNVIYFDLMLSHVRKKKLHSLSLLPTSYFDPAGIEKGYSITFWKIPADNRHSLLFECGNDLDQTPPLKTVRNPVKRT